MRESHSEGVANHADPESCGGIREGAVEALTGAVQEAERFLVELRERFAKFSLELHPARTRLLEFGRFAASNRRERGQGKPLTFD